MKSLFCLFVLVCAATAVSLENEEQKYSRFIEIPTDDGVMHQVDLEEQPDFHLLEEIQRNPADNVYLLFTRRNPLIAQTLTINNANSVTSSNFNPRVPTIVIVHGWLSNRYTNPNPTVRRAYLDKSDVNVIVMEWRRLAASTYPTAVAGVPAVGRGLGQFLTFLNSTTGAPFNTMHLIGFSLGAHVVGNAGRELGGRAARVTGLDPAGPLWVTNSNRLRPADGVYVEAIHTDGGIGGLGIGRAVADADFFPNGGESRQCNNMLQVSLNTCSGSALNLGNDDLNKRGNGLFRVNTQRRYPY
ncbi:unnamed protein product, partial [Brenthis ino]